jgi:hypothetical protein
MLFKILFHEKIDTDNALMESLVNMLEEKTGVKLDAQLKSIVRDISKSKTNDVFERLEEEFSSFNKSSSIEARKSTLQSLLKYCLNEFFSTTEDENTITRKSLTHDYYKDFFANYEINERTIRTDFDYDIQLLKSILMSTIVYAINLEKPFKDKEITNITNLIQDISSVNFANFIQRNYQYIKAEEYASLEDAEAKLQVKKKLIAIITSILDDVKNSKC